MWLVATTGWLPARTLCKGTGYSVSMTRLTSGRYGGWCDAQAAVATKPCHDEARHARVQRMQQEA